jgi:hypothetical protein
MHAQPAWRILIDKGLPNFLPVGLTIALRAPYRRPEVFHCINHPTGRLAISLHPLGEGRVGLAIKSGTMIGPTRL